MDPNAFGTFNLAQTYGQGVKIREAQDERADKQRLRDLMPKAVGGDKEAMGQVIGLDPQIGMQLTKLDAERKKAAKEELGALAADGRWAIGNPERWAQVQQKWSGRGVDLSGYDANNIERGLMELGQLEKYLEDAPKPESQPSSVQEFEYARKQGFGGGYMDFMEAKRPPLVVDNGNGTKTVFERGSGVTGGGGQVPTVSDAASYDALPPGAQYRDPQGNLRTKGGQSGAAPAGGFPR